MLFSDKFQTLPTSVIVAFKPTASSHCWLSHWLLLVLLVMQKLHLWLSLVWFLSLITLSLRHSLTWLSWQVHRSLAVLFKGSGVKPFDLEFRRLYAISKPVPGFICHTSDLGDLCLPFEKLQIPMCPAGTARNTANHLPQKPCKPRNQSFLTTPALVRQTTYPNATNGLQRSQWLPRRSTIHHTIAGQPPLFKDYNMRSQTWRPVQGNHINKSAPATSHWS